MVSSVSISTADGAGPTSSTGLVERRDLRSCRASGIVDFPQCLLRAYHTPSDVTNRCVWLEFAAIGPENHPMGWGGNRAGKLGQLVLAIHVVALCAGLGALPREAAASLFGGTPILRQPNDVPGAAPSIANPGSSGAAAPKGPMLQSLPPAANPGQAHAAPQLPPGAPQLPPGQGA